MGKLADLELVNGRSVTRELGGTALSSTKTMPRNNN